MSWSLRERLSRKLCRSAGSELTQVKPLRLGLLCQTLIRLSQGSEAALCAIYSTRV